MGNRIVVCGEIHLSSEAFERAQFRAHAWYLSSSAELDGDWRIDRGQVTAYEEPPPLPDEIKRLVEQGEIEKALPGLRALLAVS